MKFNLNHFRYGPSKQPLYLYHFLIKIDGSQSALHLPAEGQKLPGQFSSSLGCTLNLLKVLMNGCSHLIVHEKDLCIAQNGLKEIIKVMSNATGKGAHGLHLLCLLELGLQPLL